MKRSFDYLKKLVNQIRVGASVLVTIVALALIQFYRFLFSPLMGTNCRFYPTCSHYAEEAFTKFSFFIALQLTAKRLFACRPFSRGGYDPLPRSNTHVQK